MFSQGWRLRPQAYQQLTWLKRTFRRGIRQFGFCTAPSVSTHSDHLLYRGIGSLALSSYALDIYIRVVIILLCKIEERSTLMKGSLKRMVSVMAFRQKRINFIGLIVRRRLLVFCI